MAGPIQIVTVGGGFVACTARGAWNAACGAVMPRSWWSTRATCCPCRCCLGGVGLVEPRHVVVPLRRVLRPRQRVGTSPNIDLDLRTCTYRRSSGDEQVLS